MTGALAAGLLVAYNNLLNLWPGFNRGLYVPLNLAAAGALVGIALGPMGLGPSELGLAGNRPAWAAAGAGIGLAVTAGLLVAGRRPGSPVADRRIGPLGPGALAYRVLVRVPLGTVLLEELAFRGVLPAAWSGLGRGAAGFWSCLAFGLWHVTPSLATVRANRPGASPARAAAVAVLAVALTGAAGGILLWVRHRSGGLLAPSALHAAVSSGATAAAVAASRRRG